MVESLLLLREEKFISMNVELWLNVYSKFWRQSTAL